MTLYEKFRTLDLNLQALGLGCPDDQTRYFCTPKGAKIIGWPGVDGIHFCFVRGYRDMVFAISPENLPGEYVHPIAKNFKDFLRLVLACGVDAMEQCWGWTKELFDAFLQENPRPEEEKTALSTIEAAFSLKPMEEPYDYIHEVQVNFDGSKLKFTSEELNATTEEPEPENPGWHVFWRGNFWTDSGTECVEKPLHKQYFWDDQIIWIPSLYVSDEGIMLDYCTEVDPERIRAHLERWQPRFQAGTPWTKEEELRQQRENPLTGDTAFRIFVAGTELRQKNGCQTCWIPAGLYEADTDPEDRRILEHYGLNPQRGWIFQRQSYLWPNGRPLPLENVVIRMEQKPKDCPVLTLEEPKSGEEYPIQSPVTGKSYVFRVQDCQPQETEPFEDGEMLYPQHYTVLTYDIEPEPEEGQLVVRDLCQGDRPRFKDPARNANGACCACVGYIHKDEDCHQAMSSLHFEPTPAHWEVCLREKTREDFMRVLL